MSIGISAALGAEVERLRAELAEAKRDAERYRWLRGKHADNHAYWYVCAVAKADAAMLDTAIDAARKGEGEK